MGDFILPPLPSNRFSFPPLKMSVADENTPTASPTQTQGEISQTQQDLNARRVYVGNLSFKTNSTGLKEAFEQYGEIEHAHVVTIGKKRRGFGFVTFASPDDASKAVQGANGTDLDGRSIRAELSTSTTTPQKKKKPTKKAPTAAADSKETKPTLKKRVRRVHVPASEREISTDVAYLGGLATEVTKDQLKELLAPYGVQNITLRKAYRPRGAPRPRFAFIRVDTEANRDKLVADLEGKEFEGQNLETKKAFARLPVQAVEEEATSPSKDAEEKPKAAKKRKPRKPRVRKPKIDTSKDSPSQENSETAE